MIDLEKMQQFIREKCGVFDEFKHVGFNEHGNMLLEKTKITLAHVLVALHKYSKHPSTLSCFVENETIYIQIHGSSYRIPWDNSLETQQAIAKLLGWEGEMTHDTEKRDFCNIELVADNLDQLDRLLKNNFLKRIGDVYVNKVSSPFGGFYKKYHLLAISRTKNLNSICIVCNNECAHSQSYSFGLVHEHCRHKK